MSYQDQQINRPNKYPAISDLFDKAKKRIPKVALEYLSARTGREICWTATEQPFRK